MEGVRGGGVRHKGRSLVERIEELRINNFEVRVFAELCISHPPTRPLPCFRSVQCSLIFIPALQ